MEGCRIKSEEVRVGVKGGGGRVVTKSNRI